MNASPRWRSLSPLCPFFENGVRCRLRKRLLVLPMVLGRLLGIQTASIKITRAGELGSA
jgi:hypothetical protein